MAEKGRRIVIIGGGISGLTAGIYGRLAGYEVDIYEKNPLPGGECTGWDRQGFHIDNCMHWLMGTRGGTALNDIWRTVGAVDESVGVNDFPYMYRSELKGQSLTLWKDIDRTEREMLELSPEDGDEIRRLMQVCRQAQSVIIPAERPMEQWGIPYSLGMLASLKEMTPVLRAYPNMDTQDLMNRFKHPLIACLISDFCTKESAASSFPMAYGNFISGDGGVPVGGSRAMALRMAEKFQSLGGRLHLGRPAAKLNVEGNRVQSLTLADGTVAEGDWFVPACDPSFLWSTLLDESYMTDMFREYYSQPQNYPIYSMFQVALAVEDERDLLGGDYNLDVSDIRSEPWMGQRISVKTFAYEPDFAPKGKHIMQILYGGTDAGYDYFKQLYEADREAYQAKKQEIAQALLRAIEERWPEYQGKLRILDIWTPVTYERWCNAYRGYNQACVLGKNSRKNAYPSPFLRLKNVVLAGQWLSPPGGLPGAAITGKFAIARIKRKFRFNRTTAQRNLIWLASAVAILLTIIL